MLDWKNRFGRLGFSGNSARADGATRNPLLLGLAVLIGLYLLVALLVGWYWSSEPDRFPVQQNVRQAAEASQQQIVNGYTTVETLKQVAGTLLDKPGGYLTNDIAPPGLWLDNMPSWEYGVLVQVRDLSRALRKDFARSQSQSTEDPDLSKAEPLFNFDNRSWALPASESEYRNGIRYLNRYLARLSDPASKAQFYSRADNLNNWLGDVGTRLGSLSQRLSASVGRVRLDGQLATELEREGVSQVVEEERVETSWMQIDNVFYEARGQAWALSHLLRAIEVDFADVLAKKNAAISVRQIIRELEAAQEPLWSPMVLNGSGYGVLANHSLVMANYISRANAAVIDLRNLLSQG
ncbi:MULTISPECIES: DUF2333 family protein [Pseudomonadaceae]|jgi:hypothetical protein|uniref:DUF2333 domain-containing protein n=1 Tax=Stutzerimonas stutzeri TaxID=316 RepID=A0A5S5BCL6_STUST|nr:MULTISPECIES: DUF2333 family protein [Pseudomonadaceae]MBU0811916.1 DUF2333 family protein [Gammaproteobacteria bacterium]HAW24552.1 DUF2333 domain-containing protein [Pseudomonas sp.]MBK3845321.1 DUF2333 family protein [Stutzerimonas xanthomarina]MBK3846242.1 DUF2333 family protein [Stutzerimonas xanthomarina]MBU0854079.1 DUF2333 family protein [Gammaproteobacteria bacterium]|tara:strand:+ start:2344 stop:3399 length:1056 start_codon:yes stop_codon:yes gene_type:complete